MPSPASPCVRHVSWRWGHVRNRRAVGIRMLREQLLLVPLDVHLGPPSVRKATKWVMRGTSRRWQVLGFRVACE